MKTKAEYSKALDRIEELMDAEPDSQEELELDRLVDEVMKYEEKHFPIEAPDPTEAIKFRMEQEGYTPKEIEESLDKDEG